MNKYPSPVVLMLYGVACITIGALLVYFGEKYDKSSFSPPEPGRQTVRLPSPAQYTFEDLLDAIEWVESKRDANVIGDNENAVGSFQIWNIYVDDCNRLLGRHEFATEDRRCPTKSRQMVRVYLEHYGGTFEEMARKHNGGPQGHLKESTKPYWEKVKARLAAVGDQYAKELMVKEIR